LILTTEWKITDLTVVDRHIDAVGQQLIDLKQKTELIIKQLDATDFSSQSNF
jgi:hypothetical protein